MVGKFKKIAATAPPVKKLDFTNDPLKGKRLSNPSKPLSFLSDLPAGLSTKSHLSKPEAEMDLIEPPQLRTKPWDFVIARISIERLEEVSARSISTLSFPWSCIDDFAALAARADGLAAAGGAASEMSDDNFIDYDLNVDDFASIYDDTRLPGLTSCYDTPLKPDQQDEDMEDVEMDDWNMNDNDMGDDAEEDDGHPGDVPQIPKRFKSEAAVQVCKQIIPRDKTLIPISFGLDGDADAKARSPSGQKWEVGSGTMNARMRHLQMNLGLHRHFDADLEAFLYEPKRWSTFMFDFRKFSGKATALISRSVSEWLNSGKGEAWFGRDSPYRANRKYGWPEERALVQQLVLDEARQVITIKKARSPRVSEKGIKKHTGKYKGA